MKKFIYIASATIAVLGSIYFYNTNTEKIGQDKKSKFSKPYEDYFLSHNYPTFLPNQTMFEMAINDAKNKLKFHKNSSQESWNIEGPNNIGGRINCIAVHPTNTDTYLVGVASGGIFKTTNAGSNWYPVFDENASLAVSSIVYDPSNTSVLYAGTGDKANSSYSFIGNGIHKSTDGGETWNYFGLDNAKIINKIIVHPTNSLIIYAASIGNYFTRDNNKGIYRTTNGGADWQQVLYVDNETGFSDIHLHPSAPNTLFATSFRRFRNNQTSIVSGNSVKIYKSTNGGTDWNILQTNLPNYKTCKIIMNIAPSNPNKLYAAYIDSTLNLMGVYKSTNGGNNWTECAMNNIDWGMYGGFGWYFHKLAIHPTNEDKIYLCGVDLYSSSDGGQNWEIAAPPWYYYEVHADKHDMVYVNNGKYLLSTDGGLYMSNDGGINYHDIEDLPITQLYRIEKSPHSLDYYGGAQDNGTLGSFNGWTRVYGGDGFQVRFNPDKPEVIWCETQNGNINVSTNYGTYFEDGTNGIDNNDRRNWDMPYLIDHNNTDNMFTGTYRVYWNLSAETPYWDPTSGDLTDGNIYGNSFHTISAIDQSKINTELIVVGTSDANVWKSTNEGTSWTNITGSLPERYVSAVRPSPNNINNLYVTHTGYRDNDFSPHVHKTTNQGSTWLPINGDLPNFAIFDIEVFEGNENILFVATDGGVYYTVNGGISWFRLGNNMPFIPVFDIKIDYDDNKLMAGTFARSLQTIDINNIITNSKSVLTQKPALLSVYPNPTTEKIELYFEVKNKITSTTAVITDNKGNIILNKTIDNSSNTHEIYVSDLKLGIYTVTIYQLGKIISRNKFSKI